jgi:hypothetical protein
MIAIAGMLIWAGYTLVLIGHIIQTFFY